MAGTYRPSNPSVECSPGRLADGRYAAIDIGTVTCRMLVADVRGGEIVPLVKEYAVTNLGEGVDATRRLSDAALARVTGAIDVFLEVRDALSSEGEPVRETMVVSTSASRDAENSDDFVALLAERGLELAVIPGQTEAALSFMGASAAFAGRTVMVVDVGGGSTEVSIGMAGAPPSLSYSFDIGCRRVTERFWDGYPPSAEALGRAREWVREGFASGPFKLDEGARIGNGGFTMLAVAGTATSAVSMREGMEVYDPSRVHGATVTLGELEGLEHRLSLMGLPELEDIAGLDPRRAPVIVAGMMILGEAMRAAGAESYTASESDILEGMVMHMARC